MSWWNPLSWLDWANGARDVARMPNRVADLEKRVTALEGGEVRGFAPGNCELCGAPNKVTSDTVQTDWMEKLPLYELRELTCTKAACGNVIPKATHVSPIPSGRSK